MKIWFGKSPTESYPIEVTREAQYSTEPPLPYFEFVAKYGRVRVSVNDSQGNVSAAILEDGRIYEYISYDRKQRRYVVKDQRD